MWLILSNVPFVGSVAPWFAGNMVGVSHLFWRDDWQVGNRGSGQGKRGLLTGSPGSLGTGRADEARCWPPPAVGAFFWVTWQLLWGKRGTHFSCRESDSRGWIANLVPLHPHTQRLRQVTTRSPLCFLFLKIISQEAVNQVCLRSKAIKQKRPDQRRRF